MIPAAYRTCCVDEEERNELILRELPSVYYIASRIRERLPKQVEIEDLVQAGVLGLMDACRNYDATKDAQFSTFAKFRIRGAILDSLRRLDWGSRAVRKKGRDIFTAIVKLESQLGRQPDEQEIADEVGMPLLKLQRTMGEIDGLFLVSQETNASGDDGEVCDLIETAQSGDVNPFELCLQGEKRAHLEEAFSHLSEREQTILSLYYYEELTMKEAAEVLGIAVSRVSQLHASAMTRLRALLSHYNRQSSYVGVGRS
jgi:RNA polymerase sigma factor for flagellar operon FliA